MLSWQQEGLRQIRASSRRMRMRLHGLVIRATLGGHWLARQRRSDYWSQGGGRWRGDETLSNSEISTKQTVVGGTDMAYTGASVRMGTRDLCNRIVAARELNEAQNS